MIKKIEVRSLIILEILFGLCAVSVVVYQVTGRFDFGFGFVSYRFFNIAFSILFIGFLIYGLLKSQKNVLVLVTFFSLFHIVEGSFVAFWFKVVIHFLILMVIGCHYYRHKTMMLR